MSEPLWLGLDDLLAVHDAQVAVFGGVAGVRDSGLLESALARPQQLHHYGGEGDLLTLAVRLGVGLALNHPFVDGNKRSGLAAMIELVEINGWRLDMPNDETLGRWVEAVVEDRMSEEALAEALFPHLEAAR